MSVDPNAVAAGLAANPVTWTSSDQLNYAASILGPQSITDPTTSAQIPEPNIPIPSYVGTNAATGQSYDPSTVAGLDGIAAQTVEQDPNGGYIQKPAGLSDSQSNAFSALSGGAFAGDPALTPPSPDFTLNSDGTYNLDAQGVADMTNTENSQQGQDTGPPAALLSSLFSVATAGIAIAGAAVAAPAVAAADTGADVADAAAPIVADTTTAPADVVAVDPIVNAATAPVDITASAVDTTAPAVDSSVDLGVSPATDLAASAPPPTVTIPNSFDAVPDYTSPVAATDVAPVATPEPVPPLTADTVSISPSSLGIDSGPQFIDAPSPPNAIVSATNTTMTVPDLGSDAGTSTTAFSGNPIVGPIDAATYNAGIKTEAGTLASLANGIANDNPQALIAAGKWVAGGYQSMIPTLGEQLSNAAGNVGAADAIIIDQAAFPGSTGGVGGVSTDFLPPDPNALAPNDYNTYGGGFHG